MQKRLGVGCSLWRPKRNSKSVCDDIVGCYACIFNVSTHYRRGVVVTYIISKLYYKERLSNTQLAGFILGILSVIILSI